jgi:hypothetical protein
VGELTALWIVEPWRVHQPLKYRLDPVATAPGSDENQSGVKPPHSKLTPELLLQFIESFDGIFLIQMLSFRNNRFAADYYFTDGRAGQRKHDRR